MTAMGFDRSWLMRQERRPKRYTNRWAEILEV